MNTNSPMDQAVSTPGKFVVATPESNNAPSPKDAPSPLSKAPIMKRSLEQTKMSAVGRSDGIVKTMNKKEAALISSWLDEFWFYAFKAAKHWGAGPRCWNADLLHATLHPGSMSIEGLSLGRMTEESPALVLPSQICRRSIHDTCDTEYKTSEEDIPPCQMDSIKWRLRPNTWKERLFQRRLLSGLKSSHFTKIDPHTLPVATSKIARAAAKSPRVFLRESLGFAIMGRNLKLIDDLCQQIEYLGVDLGDLNPLHLAINYLDGSRSCCNILTTLMDWSFDLPSVRDRRRLYVNDMGHTLLDALMMAILKSHTSATPQMVDERLANHTNFAGEEEVDICGRWDADSASFRALVQREQNVPKTWKHKFCHVSSQAICHCITEIHRSDIYSSEMSLPSGLFLNHCFECGLKLQLTPLHTLVVTAFHLANSGCEGEDLFGMLACILTALSCGLDPCTAADVSADLLFGEPSDSVGCTHRALTPAELADGVPKRYIDSWSLETRTGWDLLRLSLWKTQDSAISARDSEAHKDEMVVECSEENGNDCKKLYQKLPFNGNSQVNDLFTAVQAELVAYRRIHEGHPWVSENINLENLLQDLRECEDSRPSTTVLETNFRQPVCSCGNLDDPNATSSTDYQSYVAEWCPTELSPFAEGG